MISRGGNYEKGNSGPGYGFAAWHDHGGVGKPRYGATGGSEEAAQRSGISGKTFETSAAPARHVAMVFRVRQSWLSNRRRQGDSLRPGDSASSEVRRRIRREEHRGNCLGGEQDRGSSALADG